MKQVNLPLKVAKQMYFSQSEELTMFALANYTKEELESKELPKTWEELNKISGYYIEVGCDIKQVNGVLNATITNKNIFATKEQAEASIALAQLSQLMQVYNDGWIPNWEKDNNKYIIQVISGKIITDFYCNTQSFLVFKTPELRNEFLKNFRDLIEQAKPLL